MNFNGNGQNYLFTSESVTEGHPDKIADQVSDAVLDAILAKDPRGRVACETLVTTSMAVIAGEITTHHKIDIAEIARQTIKRIGYDDPRTGFDYKTLTVLSSVQKQSPDIAMGVDKEGAGDQGMMFGFACRETKNLMPLPIELAHQLVRRLSEVRRKKILPYLWPDGKSQVTVEYHTNRPVRVDTVVISAHHMPGTNMAKMRKDVIEKVITPVIPKEYLKGTRFFVNPTGRFEIGGPQGDTGLTGRKIIADTYGGRGRHGGGAFSGKDPTKVDRSACYMARYVAKNIVAAGLSDECEVQLSYAIGVAEPVSIMVDTFGTGRVDDDVLEKLIRKHFALTPRRIIETLKLRRPIYQQTAAYGHFGRTEPAFTWERTDRAAALKGGV